MNIGNLYLLQKIKQSKIRAKGCVYHIYHKKVLSDRFQIETHELLLSLCWLTRERERENITPVQRSKPKDPNQVSQLLIGLIVSLCISTRIQTLVKVSHK